MEPKKSKYDTNPLDPDVKKGTEEIWGRGDSGPATREIGGSTNEIGSSASDAPRQSVYSEAPTRHFDNVPLEAPYPSVFVPPTYSPPAPYQPTPTPFRSPTNQPSSRTVAGIGLPEKWAVMLPYTPFYLGVVVSLLELFLCPKSENRVRFHASQGLALHVAFMVFQTLFGVIGAITDTSIGGSLFKFAAFVFLIISMVRVWKGEPHHIAPLEEPAKWFNEHIKRGQS
ncbi:MAG TPA: hypothetical protein VJU86_03585 [Pyrinomonadaceae bacterium]|nr:hypothetical protein [Pyrinomonadaceae bacterium]